MTDLAAITWGDDEEHHKLLQHVTQRRRPQPVVGTATTTRELSDSSILGLGLLLACVGLYRAYQGKADASYVRALAHRLLSLPQATRTIAPLGSKPSAAMCTRSATSPSRAACLGFSASPPEPGANDALLIGEPWRSTCHVT